ncbi:LuxR C-terminal-related transcriptional regulator [Nocardioides sp.]|uniref:LuxR C-terminal-related transcriptional regulator n=1 Tax=Nocardioides sp. TaxID=35761 RepID=UPI0026050C95|nr:LuxR C-terminal-related transcriptional regulator [Nocardioides sp.]
MSFSLTPEPPGPSGPSAAFRRAYDAGARAEALGLVERHWCTLIFDRSVHELVFDLTGSASAAELAPTPRAGLIAEAIGGLPHDPDRVRLPAGPDQVRATIRAGRGRPLVEAAILAMVSLRTAGRARDGVRLAERSRPLLEATCGTRFSPTVELVAYWHLQAAQAALHAGDLDRARLDVEHAWTARAEDVTGYAGPSAAPYGVLLAALLGDHQELGRWQLAWSGIATHTATLIEADTMARPVLIADLLIASDHLDDTVADGLVDRLQPTLAYDELWPLALWAISRHLVDVGAIDRACDLVAATLDRHRDLGPTGSMHHTFALLTRAEVELAAGRLDAVAPLVAQIAPSAIPGLDTLVSARTHLAADDRSQARRAAVLAEREARHPRVRREARHLIEAIDVEAGAGIVVARHLDPDLRRLTAQLPAALHTALAAAGAAALPEPRGRHRAYAVGLLTTAERRVLVALAGPGTLPELASSLHVSTNTLKTQLRGLYRKLGAASRDEAIALARRHGLLD